jgi:hypothetical protein
MKKAIIILAIMMLSCGYSVGQQQGFFTNSGAESSTDGFFKSPYVEYREENSDWGVMPLLPQTHGYHYDYPAKITPIGSGWLLMTGMGIGYALIRRRKKNEQ